MSECLSEQDLIIENQRLNERVKELEELLRRKNGSNSRAYDEIRAMIISKVNKEVDLPPELEGWQNKDVRNRAERQIMRDLKWDLRIRRISDFRDEHIQPAKDYIEKYVISEELKRNRWKDYENIRTTRKL